jgi:hypothetical protein
MLMLEITFKNKNIFTSEKYSEKQHLSLFQTVTWNFSFKIQLRELTQDPGQV